VTARLGYDPEPFGGGIERLFDAGGAAVNDDDIGAVGLSQPLHDGSGERMTWPEAISGHDDRHVHILSLGVTAAQRIVLAA